MSKTTRSEIIALAREMFRDQGYAGFSMGDLAARAGIRKASLYSRFDGKDALAQEALLLTLQELRAIAVSGDDLRGRYQALLTGLADYLIAARRCVGLHLLYGGPDSIAQANRAFFATLQGIFRDLLATGLPPDSAALLAEDSLAAIEGATLWLILDDNPAPMRRAVDALMLTLDALLRPAPSAPTDAASPAARRILARLSPDSLAGSPAEIALAEALAQTEDDLLTVRAALAGQIAAESCFL